VIVVTKGATIHTANGRQPASLCRNEEDHFAVMLDRLCTSGIQGKSDQKRTILRRITVTRVGTGQLQKQ